MPRLTDLSLHEALAALQAGGITSQELTRACLERIERLEPQVHRSVHSPRAEPKATEGGLASG